MNMVVKRIVIAGEVFSENLGDFAIYDSLQALLVRRNYEVSALDLSGRKGFSKVNVDYNKGLLGRSPLLARLKKYILKHPRMLAIISSFIWRYKKKSVIDEWSKIIESSDLVIIGGGQILTDNGFYFPPRIEAVARLAKCHQKPYAVLGCGVGSGWGWRAKASYLRFLKNAQYVSVRDRESARRLSEYTSMKHSITVCPDFAYSLAAPTIRNNERRRVGLNVIAISYFRKFVPSLKTLTIERYQLFWERVARGANASGFKAILMTNGNRDDYEDCLKVAEGLEKLGLDFDVYDRPMSPNELYSQIESIDHLIATRMHAGIIAHSFGKNVAAITWDSKIPDVWAVVGGGSVVLSPDVLDSVDPWALLYPLLTAGPEISIRSIGDAIAGTVDDCLVALRSTKR